MTRTTIRLASIAAALAVVAGLGAVVGAGTYAALDDEPTAASRDTVDGTQAAVQDDPLSAELVYDRAYRGVVEITARAAGPDGFGPPGEQRAQGSGFVYDGDGHVVTNQHVVAGATAVSVRFSTGASYDGRVVGSDPSTDLAVIRVDAPASVLRPLALGDSSSLRVGQEVFAIGSPFGLEGSITSGIVSALHRQMTAPNNFTITDSIQTDAAINHGNSGGPLLDARGRVVGVNAQIESESGGNDGVGFAIPSDTVRSIVGQLVEDGTVEHAYLGVQIATVPEGVAVAEVRAGTPAEDAGLRAATGTRTVDGQELPSGGDIVVAVDGDPVETSAELQSAIDAKRPGDEIRLTLLRGGDRRTVTVTLGTRPS